MLRRRVPLALVLFAAQGCLFAAAEPPPTLTADVALESTGDMSAAATSAPDQEQPREKSKKSDGKLAHAFDPKPVDMPPPPPEPTTPTTAPTGDSLNMGPMVASGGSGVGLMSAHGARGRAFDTSKDDRDADEESERAPLADGGEFISAGVNPLVHASRDRLSTFAIDVDTGSYTLGRRYLEGGSLPPQAGVRVEEWVNAFHYSYPDNANKHPFSIHMEGAPLAKQSMLLRIGVQGKRVAKAERAPVHLTFLVDVSGSMTPSDRLPLARQSLELLVSQLDARDSISLVTYAGATQVVLPSTTVTNENREKIRGAIRSLRNGGGTNMGDGMKLAYQEATKALGDKGISRVIVLSDGDANIGRTSHGDILKDIKGYVSEGVTMSTVGFGTGNLREHLMERLANAGNGNYSYIGSLRDAKRVFVDDVTGTLQVIAKDTKVQVEMNPDVVQQYRLIGYENRDVADRDFRNDKVDAGEIGAGHTVTAIYEVILNDDDVRGDIATVRVRYQQPRGDEVTEVAQVFPAGALKRTVEELSVDGRFAVGVALTAEVMRHSPHMERLGIGLADAHHLLAAGASGPYAGERKEIARLIAPLTGGNPVARR